jgi:hypothetical protein
MTTVALTRLAQLALTVTTEHKASIESAVSAIEHARRAGLALLEAKAQLPHGAWLPWLLEHCPMVSERTAQRYMRLAENWTAIEAKATRVSDLPIRQALTLLSEPRASAAESSAPRTFQRLALEERMARAALAVLAAELERADITIPELQAVIDRATELEQDAYERDARGLYELGRVLNLARDQHG